MTRKILVRLFIESMMLLAVHNQLDCRVKRCCTLCELMRFRAEALATLRHAAHTCTSLVGTL